MFNGNTKRIVVIKDIPSNVIEEAIFILKTEPGSTFDKPVKDAPLSKTKKKQDDYLLKEAEGIINNYIKELKAGKEPDKIAQPAKGKQRRKFLTNTVINTVLIASIALLIFIVTKII